MATKGGSWRVQIVGALYTYGCGLYCSLYIHRCPAAVDACRWLDTNDLTTLPAGVFDGLEGLEGL